MTNGNHTLIHNDDLSALIDSIEQLRNTGMACAAFKEILQPAISLHPLLYLVFQRVDEQTEDLSDFATSLKEIARGQLI